jgi:hypothetical protein
MLDLDQDLSTRYNLTVYMLGAVIVIVLAVMALSALNITVPEFVSGVVVMGFITMLKDAYSSYFKAREDIQQAKTEVAKIEATK